MRVRDGRKIRIKGRRFKRILAGAGTLVAGLVCVLTLQHGLARPAVDPAQLAQGQALLQQAQAADVAQAQAQVDARAEAQRQQAEAERQQKEQEEAEQKRQEQAAQQEAERQKKEAEATALRTLRKQFKGSVIVGDSITEALADYGFLPRNNVVSHRGISVKEADAQISTVIGLAPDHIFLSFGMNDLPYFLGDADEFVKYYEQQIAKLRQALPEAKIYVNSVLPVQQNAIDENAYYGQYPKFNTALEEMCARLDIPFIDNNPYVEGKPEMYKSDGIHVVNSYYIQWMQHMAQVAGLDG